MPPLGETPAVLGGTAIKPVERHGIEAIKWFFWDPNKRAIMGRTPKSWALITLFYCIYYAFLAGFWALMMYIFLLTVNNDSPKWVADNSLIGTSPGLGLRPEQPDEYISSSMIIFNKDSELSTRHVLGWDIWREQVDKFLTVGYRNSNLQPCLGGQSHSDGSACKFDLKANLGPCGTLTEDNYGYSKGQPCVYFKLNKIFGVANEPFNGSIPFPDDMPQSLIDHINSPRVRDKNQVWVDCHGENPADVESMGVIRYYPESRGLPSTYFPYKNQRPYESPLVAIKFMNATLGQLLHIECRAWANNIGYDRMDRIGMAHFELMILNNKYAKQFDKSIDDED